MKQYFVLNERIDFYLPKHKLAIEVDELGHLDKDVEDKIKRQKKSEKCLGCTFIRINLEEKDFDVCDKGGEIESCTDESNKDLIKKLTEKSTKNFLNRQSFKNTTKNKI